MLKNKVNWNLTDQKNYDKLKENSEILTSILIVVYGILNIWFPNLDLWNLVPGILAAVNFLVKIYILKLFYESHKTWKGSRGIWLTLITGDFVLIVLFLRMGGLI